LQCGKVCKIALDIIFLVHGQDAHREVTHDGWSRRVAGGCGRMKIELLRIRRVKRERQHPEETEQKRESGDEPACPRRTP